MKIKILSEHGYNEALLGLSLSYNSKLENMLKRADQLASMPLNSGENKFLESIVVWLDLTAPRYFWQEFDTYRVGITKQSESTMHTLTRKPVVQSDFEDGSDIPESILEYLNLLIERYKLADGIEKRKLFKEIKSALPEGYLQRRIITINYKSIAHFLNQRKNHELDVWIELYNYMINNSEHKELLEKTLGNVTFSAKEMKWIREYFDADDCMIYEAGTNPSKEFLDFLRKLQ